MKLFSNHEEEQKLKYEMAQQIRARISREAETNTSEFAHLTAMSKTLIEEVASLKIEVSKLALQNAELIKQNKSLTTK